MEKFGHSVHFVWHFEQPEIQFSNKNRNFKLENTTGNNRLMRVGNRFAYFLQNVFRNSKAASQGRKLPLAVRFLLPSDIGHPKNDRRHSLLINFLKVSSWNFPFKTTTTNFPSSICDVTGCLQNRQIEHQALKLLTTGMIVTQIPLVFHIKCGIFRWLLTSRLWMYIKCTTFRILLKHALS